MSTTTRAPAAGSPAAARWITEILSPWVVVLALSFAVSWAATRTFSGTLGWGLVIGLSSSLIPMAIIVIGARAGRWDGHHVRNRSGRLIPFVALLVSAGSGLVILLAAGAPQRAVALDGAMLTSLALLALTTLWWKISLHTSVSGGAVAILATTFTAWFWLLLVVVTAIGWSRVQLADHTPGQTLAGGVAGTIIGGLLYQFLLM